MGEAFHLGGWGMYPTTVAGLALVAVAIRYALAPDARRRQFVRALATLTALTGALGFTAGCIKTFLTAGNLAPTEAVPTVFVGVGESAHDLGLMLCMLVLAAICVAIGAFRTNQQPGVGATELHGL